MGSWFPRRWLNNHWWNRPSSFNDNKIKMDPSKDKIPDHHVWDLKNEIAAFVSPRLSLFIDKVEAGDMIAIPDWVHENGKDMDESELNVIWSTILKEMLFPFEIQIQPDKYNDKLSFKEIESRKKKGLELFAKYYNHLWD